MQWWREFMRRQNRMNTAAAMAAQNQAIVNRYHELDKRKAEVSRQRDWMNTTNVIDRRCKIGWVRLKGLG